MGQGRGMCEIRRVSLAHTTGDHTTSAHVCFPECIALHLRVPVRLLQVCLPAVHKQQLRRQVVGCQRVALGRQRRLLLCTPTGRQQRVGSAGSNSENELIADAGAPSSLAAAALASAHHTPDHPGLPPARPPTYPPTLTRVSLQG